MQRIKDKESFDVPGHHYSHHYSTFTYYGSLEIEKLLKIFFLGQIGGSQEAEAGECDFDSFLPRSFAREIFGTNMTSFWHHYFRAIWPDQRKSCPRDVIFLSPRAWQKACEHFDTLYDNA